MSASTNAVDELVALPALETFGEKLEARLGASPPSTEPTAAPCGARR